jgi:hypothetical protein
MHGKPPIRNVPKRFAIRIDEKVVLGAIGCIVCEDIGKRYIGIDGGGKRLAARVTHGAEGAVTHQRKCHRGATVLLDVQVPEGALLYADVRKWAFLLVLKPSKDGSM